MLSTASAKSQELFVFTEPASNMSAQSLGVRLTNVVMKESADLQTRYQLMPEIMWGASKNWMFHISAVGSARANQFKAEGASVYAKYRFYSSDDIHRHFRMALFGRAAFNNSPLDQASIDLKGFNSGYELGVVATQLLNKWAFSANLGWVHAANNGNQDFDKTGVGRNALEYSLSVGKLLLPKSYTSFDQVNWNVMLEMLGQYNDQTGQHYMDLAPSLQWIFNSRTRIDLGYRVALVNQLPRSFRESWLLRAEFNFFNLFK